MATAIAFLLSLLLAAPPPQDYESLRRQAEREFAEKSFARAHALYEQAAKLDLAEGERKWVEFRLVDTAWRATPEDRRHARELKALSEMTRSEKHDRQWAEANESLGDLLQPDASGAGNAYYEHALEFWAASTDIDAARDRYLRIVFAMMERPYPEAYENPAYVPRNRLLDALKLARTEDERAHLRYLLSLQLAGDQKPISRERAIELLEQIIALRKATRWYDRALTAAAYHLSNDGAVVVVDGKEVVRHDYDRALEYYRRVLTEFTRETSREYVRAQNAIDEISSPRIELACSTTFLPGSEQEVLLTWRNTSSIEFTLRRVDLTRVTFDRVGGAVRDDTAPVVRHWREETHDAEPHAPGRKQMRMEPRLPTGAYVLSAEANWHRSDVLILVSDASILLHEAPGRADIYFSDVKRGAPIAGANVRVWFSQREPAPKYGSRFMSQELRTDAGGIAHAELRNTEGPILVTAAGGPRQAMFTTYASSAWDQGNLWHIYAFTDRPAYRPGETVHWKLIGRVQPSLDAPWTTPAKRTLTYLIRGPRGEKAGGGTATFNDFGSFWADFPLPSSTSLGQYAISFTDGKNDVGWAQLFTVEEYKLPELTLSITTPNVHRLGDTVETIIEARYYFGAPVTGTDVEVTVTRAAVSWAPDGSGREVLKTTVPTDANGRARIRFETTLDVADSVYGIYACTSDASRRPVCAYDLVTVMMQRYRVTVQAAHCVAQPGDPVSVEFKALDAKQQPVRATGNVTVTRRSWSGGKQGSYRDEDVTTASVATDVHGVGTFRFRPTNTGYYRVSWTSEDATPERPLHARDLVKAETVFWVTRTVTNDIAYHASGLEIIVDSDGLRAGGRAPVLIATPAGGRWVLLTLSGSGILDTRLLHLDGTAKLIEIPLDDRYAPNFHITASSIFNRAFSTTQRDVTVSDEKTIAVEVKSDRDEYKPRETGNVTISTRDASGKPIAAEVALAVTDESVTAIAPDMAGDPHDVFYPKRGVVVSSIAELLSTHFANLVNDDKGNLIDETRVGVPEQWQLDRLSSPGGRVAESITVTAAAPLLAHPPPATPAKPEIVVRHDFRSTAFWKPDIVTGGDGTVTLSVAYPEALTTWRATARAVSVESQFGMGSAVARTNLPLLVRLEGPRFFVAGDRSTVSAVINNNGDEAVTVTPSLDATGVTITASAPATIEVPPHGAARADWTIAAEHPGTATLRVSGRTSTGGDAMEKSFTVYEHGIEKLIAHSGRLHGSEALVRLDLPAARRDTSLVVRITPSLAVAMIDALPYLVDYAYGCTEQTMSRFLPAAIVARSLTRSGLDRGEVERRITGGDRRLDDIIRASLDRLRDFQHANGGWGWWQEDESNAHMTAYVVWGFAVAREGEIAVDDAAVERAARWLDEALPNLDDDPNEQAWVLHAVTAWRRATKHGASEPERRAFENSYQRREHLTAYSRALLALAAHDLDDVNRANVLTRNLENGMEIDRAPDRSVLFHGSSSVAETMPTAHWGSDSFWWRWYDSPVESTAFSLQALVAIDPHNALVEPVMNWLVKNRRGARWNNTRDTAIAILALTDYLAANGESSESASYELAVNGQVIATKTVATNDVLRDPSEFTIDAALVRDANEIRIRRSGGNAPIYFAAEARMTSLEEPVTAAGNEIFVKREYLKLVPHPTLLNGTVQDRVPLRDGEPLASGDRIEVVVSIETKNDYEYLLFEDLKPAGLEATNVLSGTLWASGKDGRTAWVYRELRDRNVALFADRLLQGTWEIRYELRAETPGSFHALPLIGQAMYVPEIRANGEEVHVVVRQ